MKKHLPSKMKSLPALLFWGLVWALAAWALGKPLLLPSPLQVLRCMGRLALTPDFWRITLTSIGRILLGLGLGMGLGALLAVLTEAVPLLDALIAPAMTAMQATPVASFAILVLICGMMVLPVVYGSVSAGIRTVDVQLLEMAKVSSLPLFRTLRRIYVPSVMPFFRTSCCSALGLGWKAGIAAEVLTVPKQSMGRMISEAKLYLMTEELFAWTLAVVLLSLLLQKLMLRLMEGRKRGC